MKRKEKIKSTLNMDSNKPTLSSLFKFERAETIDLKSESKLLITEEQWPTNFKVLKILGVRKCSERYLDFNSSK